jgi:hypothetical protein
MDRKSEMQRTNSTMYKFYIKLHLTKLSVWTENFLKQNPVTFRTLLKNFPFLSNVHRSPWEGDVGNQAASGGYMGSPDADSCCECRIPREHQRPCGQGREIDGEGDRKLRFIRELPFVLKFDAIAESVMFGTSQDRTSFALADRCLNGVGDN